MVLNSLVYYALPFLIVYEFTNNRFRYNRNWSQVDGAGIGLALILLFLFQIIWTLIDGGFIFSGALIGFDFLVWRPLAGLLGMFLAWSLVSANDVPSIIDLYWAPGSNLFARLPSTVTPRLPRDEYQGGAGEKIGFGLLWFLEFLIMILAPFVFFFGNPETAGDTTGQMAVGMGLYAGITILTPIICAIVYRIIGWTREDKTYPAGPMFGAADKYRHQISAKYFWWGVANFIVVFWSAIGQIFITHPGSWAAGTYSFSWPFWYILILVVIAWLFNAAIYLWNWMHADSGVSLSIAAFHRTWDASTTKLA